MPRLDAYRAAAARREYGRCRNGRYVPQALPCLRSSERALAHERGTASLIDQGYWRSTEARGGDSGRTRFLLASSRRRGLGANVRFARPSALGHVERATLGCVAAAWGRSPWAQTPGANPLARAPEQRRAVSPRFLRRRSRDGSRQNARRLHARQAPAG